MAQEFSMREFAGSAGRPRFDDSIAQLIRSAERFIAQEKYSIAREQLGVARTLDPRNSYIDAILERISHLETGIAGHIPDGENDPPHRYLTVSVGPEFASGVRSAAEEPQLSQAELQSRIRQLTTVAEKFLDKGSLDNAFDSLMKAYLLDPVSPYVLSCEKAVLPAWQGAHEQAGSLPSSYHEGVAMRKFFVQGETTPPGAAPIPPEQEERLEALKLQKEMERREHDRALWREASRPSKVFGEKNKPDSPSGADSGTPAADEGLFAKLKRGKFLGQ